MVIQKGKTSKQRHKQAAHRGKLRENAARKRAAKKAGKLKHSGKKRLSKQDRVTTGRSAPELVAEVVAGTVHATIDETDARSLANLLKVDNAAMKALQQQRADAKAAAEAAAATTTAEMAAAAVVKENKKRATAKKAAVAAAALEAEAAAQAPVGKLEGLALINAQMDAEEREDPTMNERRNSNHYTRRGPALAFWERIGTHPLLVAALRDQHFTHPTPVQQASMPSTMALSGAAAPAPDTAAHTTSKSKKRRNNVSGANEYLEYGNANKDFVISAETGSGKTLTFALPILQRILVEREALNDALAASMRAAAERAAYARGDRRRKGVKASRDDDEDDEEDEEAAAAAAPAEEGEDEGEEEAAADDEEYGDDEDDEDPAMDPLSDAALGNIKPLHALVLTPTRELALQIASVFKILTVHCRQFVRVACIVGGMAVAKQQRLLNAHPDVIISTPGRLWALTQHNEGAFLGHGISRRLSVVVLDEADRLIESGKYEELQQILARIRCDVLPRGREEAAELDGGHDGTDGLTEGIWDEKKQEFVAAVKKRQFRRDEPTPMPAPPAPAENHRTTTFVTSATLSLQVNFQNKNKKDKRILRTKNADTMKLVMNDLGLQEKSSAIFDLAPDAAVVAKLQEAYLRCPEDSKELYLYYFIKQYSSSSAAVAAAATAAKKNAAPPTSSAVGRTVVFVNAISMLRRLVKILEILGVPVVGLHASMQQRQRLKVIDAFRAGRKPVLIATDVAARGLDVDGVKYVVHYQLPRSTDSYIHRCGRTARCGGEGFSCVFINPDEYNPFKQLMASMGRSAKLEVLGLDQAIVHKLVPQHRLALEIDKLAREVRKKGASTGWVERMASDADLDHDDMGADEETKTELRQKLKASKMMQRRLQAMQRADVGRRGAFLSAPRAIGAAQAVAKVHERAERQIRMHRTEPRR